VRKEIIVNTTARLGALLTAFSLVVLVPVVGTASARSTPHDSEESGAAADFATAEFPALGGSRSLLATLAGCSSGAHTLSHFGDRVYPEMGNGGYTSLRSLEALVSRFSTNPDVTSGLNDKLAAAAKAKTAAVRAYQLNAFEAQVRAQTGKALTAAQADILIALAEALR
jgi:hypothetical protein